MDKNDFLNELVIDIKIKNQLWQKIFKKELMKDISFPENVSLLEDYAILHKVVLKAEKIYYLSEILYFYRIRENSIVTKLSIDKNYKAYLIAKERYNYLLNKNLNVPKIGYLIQALILCIQYHKMQKNEQIKNKVLYNNCKNEIDKNIKYVFTFKRCNIGLKFKFLLCKLNLLKWALFIKKLLDKK